MPSTLVEKIIARAAGKSRVAPGDIVTCKVDLAMFHDTSEPRRIAPRLRELGARIWDPSKVVVVCDHFVPAFDAESAAILQLPRDWCRDDGIAGFYDMQDICQVMLAERAHLRPGSFCVGGDSHSTMGGAFGCYMAGFGATELAGVMVTGKIWTRVPESVLVRLSGNLPDGTTAKDIILFLCRLLGTNNSFRVIEYSGSTIEKLSMSERMVLTNMAAELGADTALIAPDAVTLNAIRSAGGLVDDEAASNWRSDPNAHYEARYDLDASTLVPQIARPHSPANALPITDAQGTRIDQAYIGASVGAKLSDLRMAARVLKDRKVANGVRLLIAPGSAQTARTATADGTLTTLVEAGAILLPTGCGARADMGAGILADGEFCSSATHRSFKGRMGYDTTEVYLGSPYTVAASAITGHITDPRPYLEGRTR
jgi:3-isopropylmalate/(R)-2-methylmalate dehydratase large subunit